MALDKKNDNIFYLFGRYVAVVERSNNKRFSHSQLTNIMDNTSILTRYDFHKANFMDLRQEIMAKVSADGWTEKVLEDSDGSRYWLGYYHQKSALPLFVEEVKYHKPDRVSPIDSNEIEELKDERPATSE